MKKLIIATAAGIFSLSAFAASHTAAPMAKPAPAPAVVQGEGAPPTPAAKGTTTAKKAKPTDPKTGKAMSPPSNANAAPGAGGASGAANK
jgi:hypothetical protein